MRGKTIKRPINPDPKYHSPLVSRLINQIMRRGKKTTAQGIVYDCFEIVKEKTKQDPIEVFETAIKNIAPDVEVKSRRVGGGNYQIPIAVVGDRKNALAFRWLIGAARAKKGQPMFKRLATVLFEASQGLGDAMKKREDVHRMAEANKAFAHFARFAK